MSRQERAKVSLPAIYHVGGDQGEGLVGNLSRAGLFLQGPMLPKEGEHVVIKFTTPNGREITVEGTVRWATRTDAGDTSVPMGVPLGFGVNSPAMGMTTSSSSRIFSGSRTPSTG